MSVRPFALLAASVFLFTGCDFIQEVQPSEGVSVTINSVEVESLRQRPWDDDGTGPDLFAEVQDPGGNTYTRSTVIPDADLSQPLTFTFPNSFEVATATSNMFLNVFDDDGDLFTVEFVGGSQAFTASEVNAAQSTLFLIDFNADRGRRATYTLFK